MMKEMIAKCDEHLIQAYKRYPIAFDHGEGVYLFDVDGKKYLDFMSGIGVFALGYAVWTRCFFATRAPRQMRAR